MLLDLQSSKSVVSMTFLSPGLLSIYTVRRKKSPTDLIKTFGTHTGVATSICFGDNARSIVSAGMDRTLKVYA